jgi:RNA polymerase sigma factor (sigma-70 family)
VKSPSNTSANTSHRVRLEQYAGELYRFLLRRLRRRHEAEDLLQSVYVRFLQTPHTDAVRQPRAYLYRIAMNMVAEFHLRLQREPVVYNSEMAASSASEVAAEASGISLSEQLALEEELQRIVGQLPRTYRAVLLMRTLEGLSFKEIGKRCGITEQSARKYLVRAVAQCRAADWRERK